MKNEMKSHLMHVLMSIKQNKRYMYFDCHLCCTKWKKRRVSGVTPRTSVWQNVMGVLHCHTHTRTARQYTIHELMYELHVCIGILMGTDSETHTRARTHGKHANFLFKQT